MPRQSRNPKTGVSLAELIFCEHFVSQGPLASALKAAAYAGYKQPQQSGQDLLGRPAVQVQIAKLRVEARDRCNLTVDDIIHEYIKIAFADIRDMYDEQGRLKNIHDMSSEIIATIKDLDVQTTTSPFTEEETITSRVRRHDKLTALEALRELLGFKEQQVTKMIKRDADGKVIETTETLSSTPHKVIFEDNTRPPVAGSIEALAQEEDE